MDGDRWDLNPANDKLQLCDSDRLNYFRKIFRLASSGELVEFGELIRGLRTNVAMLDQVEFSRMCKVRPESLVLLEAGKLDPEVDFLNAILMLFGYQVGITKINSPLPLRVKARRDRSFAYEHHAWHHD